MRRVHTSMDGLFKRIETGQYVAFSVVFSSPHGVMRNMTGSALFSSEDDAELYMRSVTMWYNSMFPSCCVEGCIYASVERELVSYDGLIVHGMSGRIWRFSRVESGSRAFATWKERVFAPRFPDATPTSPTMKDCEELAREMCLPHAREDRMRCMPCLRNVCCLLDCFMVCIPTSISRCW